MTTQSARLGLIVPGRSDSFVTADLAANYATLDRSPGVYPCLSTGRPTWSAPQAGMLISETDTGLLWRWTGSAWARVCAAGRLKTTAGAYAYAARGSQFATTSQSAYVVALTLPNVVVPDGGRPLSVHCAWDNATNANGFFFGLVARSGSVGGPTVGGVFQVIPAAGNYDAEEPSGLAAGTYTYSVQVKAVAGGTATLSGLIMYVTEG